MYEMENEKKSFLYNLSNESRRFRWSSYVRFSWNSKSITLLTSNNSWTYSELVTPWSVNTYIRGSYTSWANSPRRIICVRWNLICVCSQYGSCPSTIVLPRILVLLTDFFKNLNSLTVYALLFHMVPFFHAFRLMLVLSFLPCVLRDPSLSFHAQWYVVTSTPYKTLNYIHFCAYLILFPNNFISASVFFPPKNHNHFSKM